MGGGGGGGGGFGLNCHLLDRQFSEILLLGHAKIPIKNVQFLLNAGNNIFLSNHF